MQHFFVSPDQVGKGQIVVKGSDVNHMKNVLRMGAGEELTVSDGNNGKYLCVIDHYEGNEKESMVAYLNIMEEQESDSELESRIFLFQGLPKQDKMEFIVQKAVELGVFEIVPVATKRAVVKLDEKKSRKKMERWQEIAKSAAKQSGRGIIPFVGPVLSFKEALELSRELDVVLIPYELAEDIQETKNVISQISRGQSVGIFIGPEGGFDKEEIELAVLAGAKPITLGKRILRTETAGVTAMSILMFHLEQ